MILHTRTILTSPSSNQHHRMLLHIMPYYLSSAPIQPSPKDLEHTFTRNICRNNLPTTQPDPSHLPLSRIRLLRLRRAYSYAYTFHLRSVHQRRRGGFARALGDSAAAQDLVVGCLWCGGRGEASGGLAEGKNCNGGGRGRKCGRGGGKAEEGGEEFGGHGCCGW